MSQEGKDRILEFFRAAADDPSLIEKYREGGLDYLREQWGFTDGDIGLMEQACQPSPWSTAMTVFPRPPIVHPNPPTVFD